MKLSTICRPGQIARPMPVGRARERETSETHPIFRAHKFYFLKKKKSGHIQIYNRIGKAMKKILVNSKYYREHQRSCDILMFIYLTASKLVYILMDWETFDSFMMAVPII